MQHDYNIANQTMPSARTDLNNLFQTIAGQNSGSSAPSTTFAYMFWADTTNNLLKQRDGANSAWIILGPLDNDGFGILRHTGNPNGAKAAWFKGQICLDTTNNIAYMATAADGTTGGTTWSSAVFQQSGSLPRGYLAGPVPLWKDNATVTFKAGLIARSDDNTYDIRLASDLDVALSTSGAAGLDTGSEASNTWYWPWLIAKSSDNTVSVILSTSATAPTLPSGYNKKRLIPFPQKNDASSNILKTQIEEGWPYAPLISYVAALTLASSGTAPTRLINGTGASFPTAQSAAAYAPSLSTSLKADVQINISSTGTFTVRATGETHTGSTYYTQGGAVGLQLDIPLNTSQSFDWGASPSCTVDVKAYKLNRYTNGF